jgi:hypothetical protein
MIRKKMPMNSGGPSSAFLKTPERNKIAIKVNIPTGIKEVILAHLERYRA